MPMWTRPAGRRHAGGPACRTRGWGALLALLLLAACATPTTVPARATNAVSGASVPAGYLPAGSLDLVRFLPPPPAAGSAEQARDLAIVLARQAERTPAATRAARLDQEISVSHFAGMLGERFDARRLPRTFALARRSCEEASFLVLAAKRHWNRPRPFVASDAVEPVVRNLSAGSYPSGHAACGYLWSILLADLMPGQRAALFAEGIAFGESRVLGGVHYPSDLEAGRMAAAVIAARLYAEPAFREDLELARAELGAAGFATAGKPAPGKAGP